MSILSKLLQKSLCSKIADQIEMNNTLGEMLGEAQKQKKPIHGPKSGLYKRQIKTPLFPGAKYNGDVYDFSIENPRVPKNRTINANGFIYDKMGNMCPLIYEINNENPYCPEYRVDIWYPFGVIGLFGYTPIDTRPTPGWNTIGSDISKGMYLEDYLKLHIYEINYWARQRNPWIMELIKNAN